MQTTKKWPAGGQGIMERAWGSGSGFFQNHFTYFMEGPLVNLIPWGLSKLLLIRKKSNENNVTVRKLEFYVQKLDDFCT